jgi:Mg-chelatase subunit ChlD
MARKKAFKGTTHFALVWDESGSMAGLTEAGKTNISEQLGAAKDAKNVKFSLWFFGTQYEGSTKLILNAVDPSDVDESKINYRPSGGTPLYDAVGKAIRHLEDQVKKDDRALLIVFTDGHENQSREWGKDQVGKLVAEKEALDNWTLVFNAAGFSAWDAEQAARNMGFAGQSVMVAAASPGGLRGLSNVNVAATASYLASDAPATMDFYDPDKYTTGTDKKKKDLTPV